MKRSIEGKTSTPMAYKSFEGGNKTGQVIYDSPFLAEVIYECDADINIEKLLIHAERL